MVLKTTSERVSAILRASDTVARLGGDEFAFVLPTVDRESPELVAKKIMDALSKPIETDNNKINSSGSIGLSLFPDHGETTDSLIGKADAAMYTAKRGGGGVCIYDETANAKQEPAA